MDHSKEMNLLFLNLLTKLKKNQPIEIYGNGKQIRSFCYVDDAVEALIKIIFKKSRDKIYNIGNNKEPISINNLAKVNN